MRWFSESKAPVKFFMPAAKDDAQAEAVYQGLVEGVAKESRPLTKRRIFRVEFVHDGEELVAQVGERLDGDIVIAILETADGQLLYAIRPFAGALPDGNPRGAVHHALRIG